MKKNKIIRVILGLSFLFVLVASIAKPVVPTIQTNVSAATTTAKSKTTTTAKSKKKADADGIVYPDKIDKWPEKICYRFVVETLNFNLGSDMAKVLKAKTTTKVMKELKSIYKLLIPVGEALVVMYFLLELIDKTTRDSFSLEHFFRLMLKLVTAKLLIENGWDILNSFMKIGDAVFSLIAYDKPKGIQGALDAYATQIQNTNTIGNFAMIVQWIIPWLFSFICRVIAMVICWGRILELGIRAVGAPIGMADIFADGLHGNGFRYLRKFLAVSLQAAVIIVVIKVSGIVQVAIIGNGDKVTMVNAVIVGLTTCMLVIRSQQFANDMVGV